MIPHPRSELRRIIRAHVKRGDFTLSSGQKSGLFFDCKGVMLNAYSQRLVARWVIDAMEEFTHWDVDSIAGVETGGFPMVSAVLAEAAHVGYGALNGLYVRKEAKDHGTKRRVEGMNHYVKRVVLLDDVITTGASAANAIRALQEEGCDVVRLLVLVDRREQMTDLRVEGKDVSVHAFSQENEYRNVLFELWNAVTRRVCHVSTAADVLVFDALS